MSLEYYYRAQAEQFSFIRIPKAMITEEMFSPLSVEAKILYGLLLDKMGNSMKLKWIDEANRVYIIYPVSEIQENLGVSKRKAIDALAELEDIGLIDRRRQGQGNPNLIYVKNFSQQVAMN